MPLAAGLRLGSYEILAPLGAGGMGEVYRASDPKLGREVAIKVLPAALAHDPAALKRFEREARAVAALSHPHILAIHDFANSNGVTYAVTELLQGETLRQRLDHGALAPRRAAEIGRDIALGLAAAHERGLVHRDLKPSNLFLTRDGVVKILDFGLARQVVHGKADGTKTDATEPGRVLGTAGYMSPEQVRGEPADHRSDIFAFGAVLYEMLSGKRAFQGDTSVETMNAILREEPPPLSRTGREIAPSLERVVTHCLEKKPEERFQSARDLAFDLGSLTATSASGAAPAVSGKKPRARRAALAAAAISILSLTAWVGHRFGPDRRSTESPTFRRLTFRRGIVQSAYFAPDERTIVYGASWEGRPFELFSVRTDAVESRPLGIENVDVVSISSTGELAIVLKKFGPSAVGTLARLPLGGGAAREVLEDVSSASWAPGGDELAVLIDTNREYRLEYPPGKLLYSASELRTPMDLSPDGKFVAAVALQRNWPQATVLAVDRQGSRRVLVKDLVRRPAGLAWSPDSQEVYFVGGKTRDSWALRAVSLSGRERLVLPTVGSNVRLLDVGRGGQFLLERFSRRTGLICLRTEDRKAVDIGWLDGSDVRGVSDDGSKIVFKEKGDGGRNDAGGVYLRGCDSSPAVRLGDGEPHDISADGKWVFTLTTAASPEIVLLPTGAGTPRKVRTDLKPLVGGFLPDGNHIWVQHIEDDGEPRLWVMGIDGSRPHLVRDDESAENGYAISPDGGSFAYVARSSQPMVAPLFGSGPPKQLPGPPIGASEGIVQWSSDGRYLYVIWMQGLPGRIARREIATGKTEPWLEIDPAERSGVTGLLNIKTTRDGRTVIYSYDRTELSDLFVATGLK